ncbi:hypothetical protein, partial [Catenulispora pinisilvae]|uniref:hypothetical protein n=1 Tax=Catenulispora pinisilvae TaxID=2705253 RepID=UPI001E5E96DB
PDETTLRSLIASEVAAAVAASAAPPAAPLPEDATTRTGPLAAITATERPGKYPGARGRDGKLYTAGDYFHAYALGAREGDWAKYGVIRAALQDEVTADIPGLLPQQIVGELLGRASRRRPVWESFNDRAMPMIGAKFSRPKITQHVKVDPQAAEKTEVASQKYKVALEDVSKTTLAGALDISQQAIDWSSPSLLNELIQDFVSIYILRTETLAATTLVSAATGTGGGTAVEWDGDALTIVSTLAEAAGNVYKSLGNDQDAFPTAVWLSVDRWVELAGLTDTTGRPLFPALNPANAIGQVDPLNPEFGVQDGRRRWIVSKRFAAKTFIVGDADMVESYENGRRFLQAVKPDVLGLDLAYMGYAAIYTPYPAALVPITDAPPPGGGGSRAKG